VTKGEEVSESAKETTPLVGGSGALGDVSLPQNDDKKEKKEKKDGKGKNRFRFGSKLEKNENESHGGRQWLFGGGATTAQSDITDDLREELAEVRRQRLGGADDQSTDNNSDDSDL